MLSSLMPGPDYRMGTWGPCPGHGISQGHENFPLYSQFSLQNLYQHIEKLCTHFKLNFYLVSTNIPLVVILHIQHHVLHGNVEIPCLHMPLRKFAMDDIILSAGTVAIKQHRFPAKTLDNDIHSTLFIKILDKSQISVG